MGKQIQVTYKYIDGAHFFVSEDPLAAGLCVAHKDLAKAYAEVAAQLNLLFEHNHGKKTTFKESVPLDQFKRVIDSFLAMKMGIEQGDLLTPSSIQPWVVEGPKAAAE